MRKNFSAHPKETEADQSSARRLSLADRRYVFSIAVSLAAKEMNKSATFWGDTCSLLCITENSMWRCRYHGR